MGRILRNKLFIVLAAAVLMLVVSGITYSRDTGAGRAASFIALPFTPVQKLISLVQSNFQDSLIYFGDINRIVKENEELKIKVDSLEAENRELKSFREENRELRQALNIKDQFASLEPLGANIIGKDMGNWFNIFIIDRGVNDGIEKDVPVLTSKGLVGRTIQINAASSKVEGIIDKNSVVSARIVQKGDLVRVRGDLQYKDQGLCLMDRIPAEADVAVGDMVETSGIGGIYPRGILIGEVKEILKLENQLELSAVIEPAVDFRRLDEVIVLKNKIN